MAQIEQRLSTKVQKETGMCEVKEGAEFEIKISN